MSGNCCIISLITDRNILSVSFQKFANLSVRINAVIPPRARESRIISFVEPKELLVHTDMEPPEIAATNHSEHR